MTKVPKYALTKTDRKVIKMLLLTILDQMAHILFQEQKRFTAECYVENLPSKVIDHHMNARPLALVFSVSNLSLIMRLCTKLMPFHVKLRWNRTGLLPHLFLCLDHEFYDFDWIMLSRILIMSPQRSRFSVLFGIYILNKRSYAPHILLMTAEVNGLHFIIFSF